MKFEKNKINKQTISIAKPPRYYSENFPHFQDPTVEATLSDHFSTIRK